MWFHHICITFVFMDVLTPEQRTKNMKAIRSKNTKMEVLLAKTLWSKGVRYRKNNRSIFGSPDLSIKKYKVAVFVDSEFFHGKDWENEKYRIKSNRNYWWPKIEKNILRDQEVNQFLIKDGWIVLRFWSTEVHKNTDICADEIVSVLNQQKSIGKEC